MPRLRQSEAMEVAGYRGDGGIPIKQSAPNSPRGHDHRCGTETAPDPVVVVGADGIPISEEESWIGGPEGKEVHEDDAPEPPVAGKPDTSPHGRVIGTLVRGRWIQADEDDGRPARRPPAFEGVPIPPTPRELGARRPRSSPRRSAMVRRRRGMRGHGCLIGAIPSEC